MSSRRVWAIAGTLIVLHVTLAWLARGPGIFGDEAVYVSLARSLRSFHYQELFRVDAPLHRMYPPGYPMLLASWSAIGGEQFDWLVLVGIASSAGALLLFFAAARDVWGPVIALASLVTLCLNPALIESSGWLLSESPFLFFEALALWAVVPGRHPVRGPVLAGAAAIAAALTRSAGVTLVVAIAAYWLWQRRYRAAVVFTAIAVVIVGGWLLFTANAPEHVAGSSYIADAVTRPRDESFLAAIVRRVMDKAAYLQHLYWQLPVATLSSTALDNIVGMPIAFASIVVGLAFMWEKWPAAVIYVVTYAALLAVWPWTVGRFLTPVMPWLVLAALLGIAEMVAVVAKHRRTMGLVAAAAVLAVSGIVGYAALLQQRASCDRATSLPSRACLDPAWADYFGGVEYVRAHVGPDAAIVSGAPATLYWHTGHRVVTFDEALRRRAANREALVLLSSVVPLPVEEIKTQCQSMTLVASFPPSAYLLRLSPRSTSDDGAEACQATDTFIDVDRERRVAR